MTFCASFRLKKISWFRHSSRSSLLRNASLPARYRRRRCAGISCLTERRFTFGELLNIGGIYVTKERSETRSGTCGGAKSRSGIL
jgi:hypothetical protein